ncbi:MAG: alpha/beta hydrolase [Paraprevotella sp.]|nr:alpha/beta hydrolase [Paraprevotella sp.]
MKKYFVVILTMVLPVCAMAKEKTAPGLVFDASKGVAGSVSMPEGKIVNYTAYTNLYYVTNIEDATSQYLNVFVPEGADESTPIFMPNYVGGYMAAQPRSINPGDASGRALAEGYVVAIPGARGRNSVKISKKGKPIYVGRAPKGLLDLKAAVRYLRHFDPWMPGNAERIISDGTSAGGAMSALLGATENHRAYAPYLKEMGAADERDDIYAAVCFCPIIDLEHADMAYEWLYGCTNRVSRPLTDAQMKVSEELASRYASYLEGLKLRKPEDGSPLTDHNYKDYIKELLIKSAQAAKDFGADIPDTLGFTFSNSQTFAPPVNGRFMPPRESSPHRRMIPGNRQGEYITGLDLDRYLNYVVSTIPLKTPPAFDSNGVAGGEASGEYEEFGDETGGSIHFTDYSLRQATGNGEATIEAKTKELVMLMNPMSFHSDSGATVAEHWYIRHGARDRDTSFPVPINLAVKLQNEGKDVNFKLPWNRPHSGDYALNELFDWIKSIL